MMVHRSCLSRDSHARAVLAWLEGVSDENTVLESGMARPDGSVIWEGRSAATLSFTEPF
jgi:hypothetical protein